MALWLKYSALALYQPRYILFHAVLLYSEGYWYNIYEIPMLYYGGSALISKL
jgi:hypothetical protein